MKKRICFLLVLLLAASAVFAAGGAEEQSAEPAGPESIVIYLWDDAQYRALVDMFNERQSDIIVEAEYIPTGEYEAKISTVLAGGLSLDGYFQKRSTDIFAHTNNGFIIPLDDLAKKAGVDLSIYDNYKDAITVDGKTMAVPFRGASWYTYYNTKVFADAGIPTPETYVEKGEWTWAKFIEVAQAVSEKLPGTYGAHFHTWGSSNVIPALQNGMQFIDENGNVDINDTLINAYKYRKELETSGAMMTLAETRATKTHYSTAFYSGKVGMLVIGSWFPGFMKTGRDENSLQGFTWDDWSITRLPCDEKVYASFGNPTFCHVSSTSKKAETAFEFFAWLGGDEGAEQVAANGSLPALVTPAVKEAFAEVLPNENALKYYLEPHKVNPQFYNKYGSLVESELAGIMEVYLEEDMTDAELKDMIVERLKQVASQVQ